MSALVRSSDFLSNPDQLVHAAEIIGASGRRQAVFKAIYTGQKQRKSVQDIIKATGLKHIAVLTVAKQLGALAEKDGSGFRKQKDLAPYYLKILEYARNPVKRSKVPTKVTPQGRAGAVSVRVVFPAPAANAIQITIDDVDSFAKAKGKKAARLGPTKESIIKRAFAQIFGDGGVFKDWGGEKSDLYTNKGKVRGARRAIAVAFKGYGTTGKLVPAKMGKNGDQVERLFDEPADVFFVVYCGQIESSIIAQMQAFAIAKKALAGQKVYFGVIDADDLGKLAAAYPAAFK